MKLAYTLMVAAVAVAMAAAAGDDCGGLKDDALAARCLLRAASWGALASTSQDPAIAGYPFAGVKSVAEVGGVPVFYLTPLDVVVRDLIHADNKTTLVVSEAASGACATRGLDAMHPFCGRVMLSGVLKELTPGSSEHKAAWRALLDKHAEFEHYPADHGWFVASLDPVHLLMINAHGPAKSVPIDSYLSAPAPAPAPAALAPPRARLLASHRS